jgi:hypothetical protein
MAGSREIGIAAEETPTADATLARRAAGRNCLRFLSSPWLLPAILALTFAVYIPSLHTYFQGDDFFQLRGAASTPTGKFILQAFDYRDPRPVPEFSFYRPMFLVGFRFCYSIFGLNPLGYHLVSLLFHMGSIVLGWLIVRRLVQSVGGANFAALIFALHPASTEALQWIARSLNTDPMTFFYLLTFLTFMNFADGGRYRTFYYLASVVCFAIAILFHTTALSLMAALPAFFFLVATEPRSALRWRSWVRFIPFLIMSAIMGLIQRHVGLGDAYKTGTFQYSSFGRYLGMALFPVLPDDWSDIGLFSLFRLLDLYFAASLIMIAATLLLLNRRRGSYKGVFAVLWLYALLFPNTTSLLVDPLTGIIPPQLYLPAASLGFFFILAGRELHDMLSPALARRVTLFLPPVLAVMFASWVALDLVHEHRDNKFAGQNRPLVSDLRRLPPPSLGSTLYIVNPPANLVALNDVSLVAAVKLYYADVAVKRISAQEADFVRSVDPSALVIELKR